MNLVKNIDIQRSAVRVQRSSEGVQHSSVDSALTCRKAGPGSIPGSAPQEELLLLSKSGEENWRESHHKRQIYNCKYVTCNKENKYPKRVHQTFKDM